MAYNHSSLSLLLLAPILLVQLSHLCCSLATSYPGTASFSIAPYRSSCTDSLGDPKTFAAVPDSFYQDGAACGQTYKITCGGKGCLTDGIPVTVTVSDICTPDNDSDSDSCSTFVLSEETFRTFAETNIGVVNVAYERVGN